MSAEMTMGNYLVCTKCGRVDVMVGQWIERNLQTWCPKCNSEAWWVNKTWKFPEGKYLVVVDDQRVAG